ncbi:unnamed protein product [Arctogadus glacialis]
MEQKGACKGACERGGAKEATIKGEHLIVFPQIYTPTHRFELRILKCGVKIKEISGPPAAGHGRPALLNHALLNHVLLNHALLNPPAASRGANMEAMEGGLVEGMGMTMVMVAMDMDTTMVMVAMVMDTTMDMVVMVMDTTMDMVGMVMAGMGVAGMVMDTPMVTTMVTGTDTDTVMGMGAVTSTSLVTTTPIATRKEGKVTILPVAPAAAILTRSSEKAARGSPTSGPSTHCLSLSWLLVVSSKQTHLKYVL